MAATCEDSVRSNRTSFQRDPRVLHDTLMEADAMRLPSEEALKLPAGDVPHAEH